MLQIITNIGETLGLCKMDEDTGGALAAPVAADGAVAEAAAGRTRPVRVHQGLPRVLSAAVLFKIAIH